MPRHRLTLQQVLDRKRRERELDREERRLRNVLAMHQVAARLPRQALPLLDGAPTSREAASPARETASTTSTRAGGLSGCSTQSA
jgi:hypothetical protein